MNIRRQFGTPLVLHAVQGAVRTRRAIVLGILVCFLLPPDASAAQAKEPATESRQADFRLLEVGHAVEGTLAGSEALVYVLKLFHGQFVRFSVSAENPVSNMQVTVSGPGGGKIEELSGPVCRFSLRLIPTISGEYYLRVALSDSNAQSERYRVTLEEQREATDEDETRVAAGRKLVEAYRLSSQDSSESKQQADQKFEDAIALFRAVGDRRGEAEVFQFLSFRSFAARDYEGAVEYVRQAQTLWRAMADHRKEAAALETMSNYLQRLGRSQESLEALNEALRLHDVLGDDPSSETILLDWLGDVHRQMGDFQEALNYYERTLSIIQAGKQRDKNQELMLLVDVGDTYRDLGEYQKALDYYIRASAGDYDTVASRSNRALLIAEAYAGDGDRKAALEYYSEAVALAQGDQGDEAKALGALGAFYLAQAEYEKAVQYIEQSLSLSRAPHLPMYEANLLYSMGIIDREHGRWQPALENLNQALSSWPIKGTLMRRTILDEIGSVYLDSGDSPKAREYYEKSIIESRASKDAEGEAVGLSDLARAESAMHQTVEARRDVEAGLRIWESLRARIAGEESRASYFAKAQKDYEFYIDLLMQMHATQPGQGLDSAALEASERARGRSLLDMLIETHADIRQGADPSLLQRERNLQQRLEARSKYQVQVLTGPHTPQQAEAVAGELLGLTSEYDETEAQIRATNPHYAALTQPEPLGVKQIQDRVLDSDTLLLEYELGEDRSYLWAVTTSTLTSFTLPKRAEIEQAARGVYEALTARNTYLSGESEPDREARIARARTEYPATAARLSEMVLGPVATLLGRKRLLISSDGALQYIPFAVLPRPGQRETWARTSEPLIVQSEIVNVPSASMVAELRRNLNDRQPAHKALAVLADPVFDDQDPRALARQQVSQVRNASELSSHSRDLPKDLQRSLADAGSSEQGWKIPRLPFSRREAEAIIADASPADRLEAVDFQASRATAMSPELAQYRVVHFATHAVLDSRTPALSGIILSLVDKRGNPQDGFLRLWDIYNLHLPAELVVLSACQTALGKEVRGEGLVGLTRGFMYAGAARVMASLWQVDDVATAELMSQFYQGFLKKNMSAAAALRAAEVSLWKQKRWQDPYFWGAFQLHGEWK